MPLLFILAAETLNIQAVLCMPLFRVNVYAAAVLCMPLPPPESCVGTCKTRVLVSCGVSGKMPCA